MKLHIAVLGYNYKLSCRALYEVAENDIDSKPKIRKKDTIIMEDGTKYTALPTNIDRVRGYHFDQLIIADDSRWMIFKECGEILNYLGYRLGASYVPEEFKTQKYEIG